MAKKSEVAKKAPKKAVGYQFEAQKAELQVMAEERNSCADIDDFKGMSDLDKSMSEIVTKYSEEAEKACYAQLSETENPMVSGVKQLFYKSVAVKDKKVEGKAVAQKAIEEVDKKIDPMRLHNYIKGGIGVDKTWPNMIERMNLEMTCRRAIELGINPEGIRATYAMTEAALTVEGFVSDDDPTKFDIIKANEHLKANMQKVVNAMIGEGYEVTDALVNFMLAVYTKKDNRKALTVTAANHKYLRLFMFEICHSLVVGTPITMKYKAK